MPLSLASSSVYFLTLVGANQSPFSQFLNCFLACCSSILKGNKDLGVIGLACAVLVTIAVPQNGHSPACTLWANLNPAPQVSHWICATSAVGLACANSTKAWWKSYSLDFLNRLRDFVFLPAVLASQMLRPWLEHQQRPAFAAREAVGFGISYWFFDGFNHE